MALRSKQPRAVLHLLAVRVDDLTGSAGRSSSICTPFTAAALGLALGSVANHRVQVNPARARQGGRANCMSSRRMAWMRLVWRMILPEGFLCFALLVGGEPVASVGQDVLRLAADDGERVVDLVPGSGGELRQAPNSLASRKRSCSSSCCRRGRCRLIDLALPAEPPWFAAGGDSRWPARAAASSSGCAYGSLPRAEPRGASVGVNRRCPRAEGQRFARPRRRPRKRSWVESSPADHADGQARQARKVAGRPPAPT